jgi:hypothetical protein
MTQTSYDAEADVAFPGMLVDTDAASRSSISRANEETSAVGYGLGVALGTDPEVQFELPAATAFEFGGVLVHSHAREDVEAVGPVEGELAELLRKGRIWVVAEEAVTTADNVFLRHTANGGLLPGGWRTDADTARADQIAQARWLTAAGAGELAQLEVNYP